MNNQSLTTSILVDQTPQQAFEAINNVRGWWSEEIEGNTHSLNDEFSYHYQDMHRCSMKIVDMVPDRLVRWLVTDNYFSFTKDPKEWKGTHIVFEITPQGDKTQVRLTHEGLTPDHECFDICEESWTNYVSNSLYKLITTGKGDPIRKETGNEFETSRTDV